MNMKQKAPGVSRRRFLKGIGAGAAGAAVGTSLISRASAEPEQIAAGGHSTGPGAVPVILNVNGQSHTLQLEPRTTLANALRYDLGLTGTKVVCDRGSCGACTVILGGKTVYSCMLLAADAQGAPIRTVESLSTGGQLSRVQEAFVQDDGLMCGYCTPGFVMSCTALVERNPHPTEADVRDALRGNLCRCGTYPRIFEACLHATGAARQ